MERYSMFLGRTNKYCENDYTTKCNLQIQCDPYQITNGIFHRTRMKTFTIYMETQKTSNSQSSLEKEEWSWRSQASWLQALLQRATVIKLQVMQCSCLSQISIGLAGVAGGGGHIKRGAKGLSLSFSLSLPCVRMLFLSLSSSLPLPCPAQWGTLPFLSLGWCALTPQRWIFLLLSK